MEDYEIRELNKFDYYNGYLELMYEFTNYKHDNSYETFVDYLNETNKTAIIVVVYSKLNNTVVGAGTIFNIKKLHNNSVCLIEDVIISEKYRKNGFGKTIINKLIELGTEKFKCYKVILNCLEKNIGFYEKCNFTVVGLEMKYIK